MISIKDFKVGDTAYMIDVYKRSEGTVPVTVVCVGTKYVSVKHYHWTRKFQATGFSEYALVEKVDAGAPSLLFQTEQAYKDYKEQNDLEAWLRIAANNYGRVKYSLEQLRKVKEILEGGEQT